MKSLRHRLPTLSSLMVFEAAGRLLNFTKAANELHVSQAAISKQIKYLESYFDFQLFIREGKQVSLSPKGAAIHKKISISFNYLANAVEEHVLDISNNSFTIAANTSISHYWLSDIISEYYKTFDNIDIYIKTITSDLNQDLFTDEVDVAIAYDPPKLTEWKMYTLFKEEMFPVASQEYLSKFTFDGENEQDFLKHKLLDFEKIEPNWVDWRSWLDSTFSNNTTSIKTQKYNNYIVLIDAAKRGQGIALGTKYMIDTQLNENKLVKIGNKSVKTGKEYVLALNKRTKNKKSIEFFNWLHSKIHQQ